MAICSNGDGQGRVRGAGGPWPQTAMFPITNSSVKNFT